MIVISIQWSFVFNSKKVKVWNVPLSTARAVTVGVIRNAAQLHASTASSAILSCGHPHAIKPALSACEPTPLPLSLRMSFMDNPKSYVAYRMGPIPMTLSDIAVTLTTWNLSDCHLSGNIAGINYDIFTHKLESVRGLQFQRSYCCWRTFQGDWQLHTLWKW